MSARSDHPDLFERVICGVSRGPHSDEAVRQAAALAVPDALEVMAVAGWGEVPLGWALTRSEAEEALRRAVSLVEDIATDVRPRLVPGGDPAAVLARETDPGDLLAVGSHGGSRAAGAVLGTVPAALMHRPGCPLLVARPPPEGTTFPGEILLATDGSAASRRAARVAGGIARRAGGRVTLVHADEDGGRSARHELSVEVVEVFEAIGVEPAVVSAEGRAHKIIVDLVRREQFSLVVLGSRGLGGTRALGSVSERVGHSAACSVMIVPP